MLPAFNFTVGIKIAELGYCRIAANACSKLETATTAFRKMNTIV